MPKTKRDLIHALADRIGGEDGDRMRAALQKQSPFDDIIDRPIAEEDFASLLEEMDRNWKAARAKMKKVDWERPGSWGLPN